MPILTKTPDQLSTGSLHAYTYQDTWPTLHWFSSHQIFMFLRISVWFLIFIVWREQGGQRLEMMHGRKTLHLYYSLLQFWREG